MSAGQWVLPLSRHDACNRVSVRGLLEEEEIGRVQEKKGDTFFHLSDLRQDVVKDP